ncbi:MAG: phosphate/phosphite/phosphonate ABC transporter substrate-binding protein [Gammaproteobacteria bacterium]|nr:phosphate/phosphite/phosphonate ABC transporter substrate-binding protein [Gammaproteobacteria bacterium]MDH5731739.1 phosphate/phosphite/phosphonate ABC transporter substrate-binding protein [Gammaproteobacteria bacterium]
MKTMRVLLSLILVLLSPGLFADDSEHSEKEITLGIFPYISSSKLIHMYTPLAKYLEAKTSRKVRLVSSPDFKTFIERSEKQQFDIIYTAPHFAELAEQQKTYRRLARFTRKLSGTFFVRASSDITNVKQLQNKMVSVPSQLAIVSHLGEVHLGEMGLVRSEDYTLKNMPTHNNVIISVLNDVASAGVVASPVFDLYDRQNRGKLRKIAQTECIPGAMFMLNNKMSQKDALILETAMNEFPLSGHAKAFYSGSTMVGIQEITDADMDALKKYRKLLQDYM